jgi:hypothetical protein
MDAKKNNEKDDAAVAVAPPPPPPEPYPAPGYPKVLYSKTDRVPRKIVNNDAELAALDPHQWTQIPPVEPKEKPTWPKLYANVNNLPMWVADEAAAAQLGSAWVEFKLPKPATK